MNDELLDRCFTILFDWPTNWARGRGLVARLCAVVAYFIWFIVVAPFMLPIIMFSAVSELVEDLKSS